jgi:putative toxin-antitoxin system antitoxin component (TIGR02293 family)
MSALAAVTEVLGGRKTLGARPRTALEWQEVILAGMPVASAEALKAEIAVADRPFAELIGISEKTLSRARAGKAKLDPVVSDRLFRLARIVALAIDVLEDEGPAVRWLKRPQFGLGGRTPLSLLATDAGRDEVEKLLLRIEHGVYT